MNKKNIYYVGSFLLLSLFLLISGLNTINIKDMSVYLKIFGFFIVALILLNSPLIVMLITNKITTRQFKKIKLDKYGFRKYKDYYRDIIKEYSPALLSYINNLEIDYKDVIATLLNLKLKKYIVMDKKIKIIEDDLEDLDDHEIYLLENLGCFNLDLFKEHIIVDALFHKLIDEDKINWLRIIKNLLLVILMLVLAIWFMNIIGDSNNIILRSMAMIMMVLSVTMIVLVFTIFHPDSPLYPATYFAKSIDMPFKRTDEANKINEKLMGLKNYLKDFSIMDNRLSNELKLWDEYLIYSVLFNQNQKIIKEYEYLFK